VAFLSLFEDQLEADPEQEQAAGHTEGPKCDAETFEQHQPGEPEQGQDHEGDDAGPERDAASFDSPHAGCHRQEQRHEPERIEDDEERDKAAEKKIEHIPAVR